MKTLQKILIGASLIGILSGCAEVKTEGKKDTRIPTPAFNQSILLNPHYLNGNISLGYTLLTDMDSDGKWDAAEKVYAGFTTGNYKHELFLKRGYSPAQSIPDGIDMKFVNPEFFEPYQ